MFAVGFRIACLALVLIASPAYAETIRNAAHRFTINKPNGWHDVSAGTLVANDRSVNASNAAAASQVAKGMVLGFSKLKEPTDQLNSSFVMIGVNVGAAASGVDPIRALYGAINGVMKTGAKTSVLLAPEATKLGGLPAARASIVAEVTEKGRTFQSQTDMWCVVRGDSVLIIQIQAKHNDKTAGMDKLRAAVKSIRFER